MSSISDYNQLACNDSIIEMRNIRFTEDFTFFDYVHCARLAKIPTEWEVKSERTMFRYGPYNTADYLR